jgi:hypothetical protein
MPGTDQLRGSDRQLRPTGRVGSLRQSGVQRIASYDHSETYEHRRETVQPPREEDRARLRILACESGIGRLETGR